MPRKFVTNPWTKIPHGHARTELIAVRDLLKVKQLESSILSETDDFGDVLVENDDLLIKSQLFKMNPLYTIFRFWNTRKYFKATINKFKVVAETGDDLIISSVNFEQFVIAAVFFGRQDLYIRVFNCPAGNLSKVQKNLLKHFLKKQRFSIGSETQEIANWFQENLDLGTQIVPPLNKLGNQNMTVRNISDISQQRNIGIFYPVTSKVDIEEFKKIISIFHAEDVHVKFPIEIPINLNYENLKIIKNGISDFELNEIIMDMDAIILMNHNYINRGSGLLTLCMSLGKIIYVFDDNNFVSSYKEKYPLISVRDAYQIDEHHKLNGLRDVDKKKLKHLSRDFVKYVDKSWEIFLNVG